jgi:hypothetical protein
VTSRRARLAGALGSAAGHLVRYGPGIAGPVLVALGVALVYVPAGVIVFGATLWLFDWRRP